MDFLHRLDISGIIWLLQLLTFTSSLPFHSQPSTLPCSFNFGPFRWHFHGHFEASNSLLISFFLSLSISRHEPMCSRSCSLTTWKECEPRSSGYGRILTFWRLRVQIPALYTGWTWHFFIFICCNNCIVCLKRLKIYVKEAGVGPFF